MCKNIKEKVVVPMNKAVNISILILLLKINNKKYVKGE